VEFTDVVQRRRMVRSYQPDRDVSRETVNGLLQLAVRAPSAGFTQGWQFVVLDSPVDRDVFWTASTTPGVEPDRWLLGMRTAPTLILALSDKDAYLDRYADPDKGWTDRDEARWPVPYWDIDTGMASLLILLGAVDSGLAGCFFGVPADRHDAVRAALRIADRLRIVGVISVGYPAPDRRSPSLNRGRRQAEDVIRYGIPPS
jgi:nitroreductase